MELQIRFRIHLFVHLRSGGALSMTWNVPGRSGDDAIDAAKIAAFDAIKRPIRQIEVVKIERVKTNDKTSKGI